MSTSLTNQACIVGVGETEYSRSKTSTMTELGLVLKASARAAQDVGISPSQIDGVLSRPIYGAFSEDFAANFGIKDLRYSVQVPLGGASPVGSLQTAAMAVTSGVAGFVLIPAGWNGSSAKRVDGVADRGADMFTFGRVLRDYYTPFGATAPVVWYSLLARRYLYEYDVPREALGAVALTARKHAQLNPAAVMHGRELSLEEYLASPVVAEPYRRHDCCLNTDGAAAVIVTSTERAKRIPGARPVLIAGVAEGHPYPGDDLTNRPDPFAIGLTYAAPKAYEMADLGPEDMSFANLYDCFTVETIRQLEEAGFCKRGDGGEFFLSGRAEVGGTLPVNPHGGLLAHAHAFGMPHVVEAVRQLRTEAGTAQIHGANAGVVTGWGDFGDGSMAVLRRP